MKNAFFLFFVFVGSLAFADGEASDRAAQLDEIIFDTNVFSNTDINSSKILTGSCNVSGKIKLIDDNYLENSSITVTDFSHRRWKIDRLFRDVFKEGTDLKSTNLPTKCLYELLALSMKETGHKSFASNTKNRCYKSLEDLRGRSRDSKPAACPQAAWQEALKLSMIIGQLQDSITAQEAEIARLDSLTKSITAEGKVDCLDCLQKQMVALQAGQTLAADAAKIREVACCKLLTEKKFVKQESDCESQIREGAEGDAGVIRDCLSRVLTGLWNGVEALNPIELVAALPDIGSLMQKLISGDNRSEVLNSMWLGLLKGTTGFEPDVWECSNSQAKLTYGCEMAAQVLTLFVGAAGILKLIKVLKEGALSLNIAGRAASAVADSAVASRVGNLMSKLKDYKAISKLTSSESIAAAKASLAEKLGGQFDTLAASHPGTIGRLKACYEAIEEARVSAKNVVKLDVAIAKAKKAGLSTEELIAQRETALLAFQQAQGSLAARMDVTLKAGLVSITKRAFVTAPAGAAPTSRQFQATDK